MIALLGAVMIFGMVFNVLYAASRDNIVAAGKEGAILSAQEFNKFLVDGQIALVTPYVDAETGQVMMTVSKMLSDGKSCIKEQIGVHI